MTNLMNAVDSSFILSVLLERAGSMIIITLALIAAVLCVTNLFIYVKKVNIVITVEVSLLSIICIVISLLMKNYVLGMIIFILMATQVLSVISAFINNNTYNYEEEKKEGWMAFFFHKINFSKHSELCIML